MCCMQEQIQLDKKGGRVKYLSVCSGIEAASVAWAPLGWQPVAFSEIEPFPSAVLAERFPGVPNLGDMTQYENWNIPPIDLLVGGTPCQAFSVAGKRGSLSDDRGNLCLTFCEIADKFDPEWTIWENVPGVLSTKDNAFGCLLGRLCGADAPIPHTRRGGHTDCGVVSGPRRTVAWRKIDAQWYGVPQRRKRIFLIAVRGTDNWACADALLPFGNRMCGDIEASREAWRNSARRAGLRPKKTITCGRDSFAGGANHGVTIDTTDTCPTITAGHYSHAVYCHDISPTITSKWKKGTGGPSGDETQNLIVENRRPWCGEDIAPTLDASYGRKWTGDRYCFRGQFFVYENHAQDSRITGSHETSPTCTKKWGTGGGNTPIVFHLQQDPIFDNTTSPCLGSGGGHGQASLGVCYCIQGDIAAGRRDNQHGLGIREGVSFSLLTSSPHVVSCDSLVRRLLPIECERLQGFPDNWTRVPYRGKPAAQCPDSKRYEAIGNSMAVPAMAYLGERIIKISGKETA